MAETGSDNPFIEPGEYTFTPIEGLSEADAKAEAELLREAILFHDRKYYVENQPVISDRAYDRLFSRLQELETAFGLETPHSPTTRVGGEPVDALPTIEHVTPLLSLDSSADEAAVREWDARIRDVVDDVTYSVEPKFDGVSIEIVYDDGALDRAVTRGDGLRGDDISHTIRTIPSVPLVLQEAPAFLAVRGEVFMPRSGFFELNEARIQAGDEPFANPRNAAAGTVRQLDPSVAATRPLDIYCYDVLETTGRLRSQRDAYDLLESVGLPIWDDTRCVSTIDEVLSYRNELRSVRDELEVELDGIVAKVDAYSAREQLGSTARHPRWAFAYKFPAVQGKTTVRRIVVQVGRTGKLTPVALLDPVDVTGVTISRASLHNEGIAQSLGVTTGAMVTVERAGDVIPDVTSVLDGDGELFEMPDTCPVCNSPVRAEGEYHYCTGGMTCPAQLRRSIEHYCSRDALNIEGVGIEVARQLVASGLVRSLADLYSLTMDDLISLESFGETSAQNLLDEIAESKHSSLDRFIYALGIRHVGRERARRLAGSFTLDELLDASIGELRAVSDIGPEVATSIHSFFSNDANRETVERLVAAGVHPVPIETSDEYAGLTVVFTGSIPDYTRREVTELLESSGASVSSTVSGETDYLVVGDNPGERKLRAADEYGVEVVSGADFIDQFINA